MTRDELIEAVARAIGGDWEYADVEIRNSWRHSARAAVDIVLEEAAKMAECVAPQTSVKSGDETEAFFLALDDAAVAIRALKSGDGE